MAVKRSVILQGDPIYNEAGVATAEVRPGYLVKGVSLIAHQTITATPVQKAFACERDELGQGIDNTRQTLGTLSAYYASGDTVKVAVCGPGDRVTAFLASGETGVEDAMLVSNGDGTLKLGTTAGIVVGRCLDAPGLVTVPTAIRVEIM